MQKIAAVVWISAIVLAIAIAHSAIADPTTAASTQPVSRTLGIVLMDASHYGWSPDQIQSYGGKLIVNGVKSGSRAARLGIQMGDVIKRINDKDMNSVEDVVAAVRSADSVKIEIIRDHQTLKRLTLDEGPLAR